MVDKINSVIVDYQNIDGTSGYIVYKGIEDMEITFDRDEETEWRPDGITTTASRKLKVDQSFKCYSCDVITGEKPQINIDVSDYL